MLSNPPTICFLYWILFKYLAVGEIKPNDHRTHLVRTATAGCPFFTSLDGPQGNIPSIGDNDDAWVVRLDDRPN